MRDSYGRTIDYMRISVTDRCNLRCNYCAPAGGESAPLLRPEELLRYEEIRRIVAAAAGLGIRKLKITGGEALMRSGCAELVRVLKSVPGIRQVTLTTNGTLLAEQLPGLLHAGLDAVNISLDTTDRLRYREITGLDALPRVTEGIEAALRAGLPTKINSVLQPAPEGGSAWRELLELARERKLDLRFIEMMPIGCGRLFEAVSNQSILEELKLLYPGMREDRRVHGNGPARYFTLPGFRGSIGFISAIHGGFCSSCNRIRLTADGKLKPCLCYGDKVDLRAILRGEAAGEEDALRAAIAGAIRKKPERHCFETPGEVTERVGMNAIGG